MYNNERFSAFVWDVARDELPADRAGFVQYGTASIVTAVFMLSAIDPKLLPDTYTRLAAVRGWGGAARFCRLV